MYNTIGYEFLAMIKVRNGKEVETFYKRIYAGSIAEAKNLAIKRHSRTYARGGKIIFLSSVVAVYLNVKHIMEDDFNV